MRTGIRLRHAELDSFFHDPFHRVALEDGHFENDRDELRSSIERRRAVFSMEFEPRGAVSRAKLGERGVSFAVHRFDQISVFESQHARGVSGFGFVQARWGDGVRGFSRRGSA